MNFELFVGSDLLTHNTDVPGVLHSPQDTELGFTLSSINFIFTFRKFKRFAEAL